MSLKDKMAKLNTYLIALIVWVLLFHFAGLIAYTPTSYILNNLGVTNPENFGSTQFWATLISILTLSVAGVSIGLIYGRTSEIVLLTTTIAFAGLFTLLLWDFISLFVVLAGTNSYIAIMLISPMMVLFGITIYEWIRGMST